MRKAFKFTHKCRRCECHLLRMIRKKVAIAPQILLTQQNWKCCVFPAYLSCQTSQIGIPRSNQHQMRYTQTVAYHKHCAETLTVYVTYKLNVTCNFNPLIPSMPYYLLMTSLSFRDCKN